MALEEYWAIAKKWWWLLILSTLVAVGSSYYSVSRMPRIYQATTTVIVGQSLNKSNPTYNDFSIGQQLAQTYVNMVQRQPILQGAAAALGLDYVPWSGNISAAIVPGTQLVEISVRDTSPKRAEALADEIARQLVLQTPEDPANSQTRRSFVQEQLQNLEVNIKATEQEIEDEQTRLDAANSARAIQQYESNIAALQQKLASYQTNYVSLLQTLSGGTNSISIIEPAIAPTEPISPNVAETVALAAAIGFVLAAGGAFLIEFLDDTIKTPDDVTRVTDLPTLGTIARIEERQYEDQLVTAYAPQSPVSEAFRALRTSIQYCTINKQLRTLVLTSAAPTEGKSITVANLAIVMAQSGYSVVLVDADMRRPVQHEIFAVHNESGLSDALLAAATDLTPYSQTVTSGALTEVNANGGTEPRRAITVEGGSLRLITAGTPPPNPADLLGSERMKDFIRGVQRDADIVLFDTPPVLAVTDAVILARSVDGVLLLADVGHTKCAAARQAAERLRQVGSNLLGVVLNRASSGEGSYYSYDY